MTCTQLNIWKIFIQGIDIPTNFALQINLAHAVNLSRKGKINWKKPLFTTCSLGQQAAKWSGLTFKLLLCQWWLSLTFSWGKKLNLLLECPFYSIYRCMVSQLSFRILAIGQHPWHLSWISIHLAFLYCTFFAVFISSSSLHVLVSLLACFLDDDPWANLLWSIFCWGASDIFCDGSWWFSETREHAALFLYFNRESHSDLHLIICCSNLKFL